MVWYISCCGCYHLKPPAFLSVCYVQCLSQNLHYFLFTIPLATVLRFSRWCCLALINFCSCLFTSLLSCCEIAVEINIVYDLKFLKKFLSWLNMFSNFSFTLKMSYNIWGMRKGRTTAWIPAYSPHSLRKKTLQIRLRPECPSCFCFFSSPARGHLILNFSSGKIRNITLCVWKLFIIRMIVNKFLYFCCCCLTFCYIFWDVFMVIQITLIQ